MRKGSYNRRYLLAYTAVWALIAAGILHLFAAEGKTFLYKTDGLYAHYTAYNYLCNFIRGLMSGSAEGSLFNFRIGQGADILTTLSGYDITDPVSIITSMITPLDRLDRYTLMLFLKLYLTGLNASIYLFSIGIRHRRSILCGAIAYAFSGAVLFMFALHPNFAAGAMYLPLILAGVERLWRRKSKWLLTLAVFVSVVSNFYTFYINVLLTMLYVLVRAVCRLVREHTRAAFGRTVLDVLLTGIFSLAGVLLSAVFLFPVLYAFSINITQDGLAGNIVSWLQYPAEYYPVLLTTIFTPNLVQAYSTAIGVCGIALLTLLLLFTKKRQHLELKVWVVLCALMLLLPVVGAGMNAFRYATNRWSYGAALCLVVIMVRLFPDLTRVTEHERCVLYVGVAVYVLLCYYWAEDSADTKLYLTLYAIIAVTVIYAILVHYQSPHLENALCLLILLGVALHVNDTFCANKADFLSMFYDESDFIIEAEEEAWENSAVSLLYKGVAIAAEEETETETEAVTETATATETVTEAAASVEPVADGETGLDDETADPAENGTETVEIESETEAEVQYPYRYVAVLKSSSIAGRVTPDQFYRTEKREIDNNTEIYNNVYGTTFQWSMLAKTTYNYYSGLAIDAIRDNCQLQGLDGRADLLALASVRFYTRPIVTSGKASLVPDGYVLVGSDDQYEIYENQYALSLGYTYDTYTTETDYGTEDALTREQILLQGAVVDDETAEELEEQGLVKLLPTIRQTYLPYRVTQTNGVTLRSGEIRATKSGGTLTLSANIPEGYEIYLYIDGVELEVEEDAAEHVSTVSLMSLDVGRSTDAYQITKRGYLTNMKYQWPAEREDICFNLGSGGAGTNTITLRFSQSGTISYDNIYLRAVPVSLYEEQVQEVGSCQLENVQIGRDVVTGEITAPGTKILQLSIPYSEGWTAYIDGEETQTFRSGVMYTGLLIEEGHHTIELHYQTPYQDVGFKTTVITFIVLVAEQILEWIIRNRGKRKKNQPAA